MVFFSCSCGFEIGVEGPAGLEDSEGNVDDFAHGGAEEAKAG